MSQPVTWTAVTAAEALDLLEAARERIESAMCAAYPGDAAARMKAQKTAPVALCLTLDTSELDRIVEERHAFNAQVRGDEQ